MLANSNARRGISRSVPMECRSPVQDGENHGPGALEIGGTLAGGIYGRHQEGDPWRKGPRTKVETQHAASLQKATAQLAWILGVVPIAVTVGVVPIEALSIPLLVSLTIELLVLVFIS